MATNESIKDDDILYEKKPDKKIAIITLNRPEKLNALCLGHYQRINDIVLAVNEDEDIKVLIFKGAGRSFCSGHDVAELGVMYGMDTTGKGRRPSQRARLSKDIWLMSSNGLFRSIFNCLKATVAQVHGYCYGGGLNISNACDITIAAENTLFTHPGWRYIGPTTDVWLVTQLIGLKKAKEMMLTGIPIDAQEAWRVGLANKVVPLEKLEEAVDELTEAITRLPFDGVVMGKTQFHAVAEAMGAGSGMIANSIMHSLQTNIRYEPGEFNLFKARREKGIKGAIVTRKAHYQE
jgi:enoyl-CoA hydratase